MTERWVRAGRVSWAAVGIAALLAIFIMVLWSVRVIFPPLILAGAIVFILNPLVTRLQHRGIPRAAGAAITYFAMIGTLVAVGLLVVPLATAQAEELRDEWPEIQSRGERWIDDVAEGTTGTFYEFTRDDLEGALDGGDQSFADQLRRLRKIGTAVFHVLLILVLAPIIAFYLLVDLPHLRDVAERLVPARSKDEVMIVAHRLNRAIGGFFRGQLMIAVIVGLICSVALGIIRLKFWFLIGMIAGVFNMIPLVGPWIGGIPGVAIALTTGSPLQALGVVIVMTGAQQVDNHFITPYVMQRAVRLHPVAVMLALLAGGTIAGFFGLLLAVPAAAVLKILIGHVWRVHVLDEPLESVTEEQLASDTAPAVGMVQDVSEHPAADGDVATAGAIPEEGQPADSE